MTLTLGRVDLDALQSYTRAGDQVTISGQLQGPTEDLARARAGQLAAYDSNPDETQVPLVDTDWDEVCGIYLPRSVKVSPVGTPQQGLWKFDATLDLVRDGARPMADVSAPAVYRSGYAINEATSRAEMARPAAAEHEDRTGASAVSVETVTSATGGVSRFAIEGTGQLTSWRYSVPPADWYDGACVLEVTFDGSTWIAWPGFQVPTGVVSWRLGNGLVRVTPSATAGRLDVQHFDGTQWETAKTYRISMSDAVNTVTALGPVSVLRNAPHIASVRLMGSAATVGSGAITLTVRRGLRWLFGWARIYSTAGVGGGIRRESTEAATSVDGGVEATSADADGNKYVLVSVTCTTKDTTNGGLSTTTSTGIDFGIGSSIGGGSSANERAQYGRWVNERIRVATL